MKNKKRVEKTNRTKKQSQASTKSRGGGRLDGKAVTMTSKRNTTGSVRERTPAEQ